MYQLFHVCMKKGQIVIASPIFLERQRWNNKNINNTEVREEPSQSQELEVTLTVKGELAWVQSENRKHIVIWAGEVI